MGMVSTIRPWYYRTAEQPFYTQLRVSSGLMARTRTPIDTPQANGAAHDDFSRSTSTYTARDIQVLDINTEIL